MTGVSVEELKKRFEGRDAQVGVIGLGYVGLPLLLAFWKAGFKVTGFDVDPAKPEKIAKGQSYLRHIPSASISETLAGGRLSATTDFTGLGAMDAILVCVPTPLTKQREPDIRFVIETTETIARGLRPGQLIVLESTTYPGTTSEEMRPILERGGLKSGRDFFLAFSPEREDPGNATHTTTTIPKIVGGDGPDALALASALYAQAVARVVPVSSMETAEAVKLTENIFRSVNIALVNELKMVFGRMGIDVWEVIDAAKTKPFGFMPFYPGPGLGGHCIPIDPFYLTWKAREFDIATRFIELAGQINTQMPYYVVDKLIAALSDHLGLSIKGARVLLLGVAYKKNVDDMRESPALKLIELLEDRGALVEYHDPFIPEILMTREHAALSGRKSVGWDPSGFAKTYDTALVCTDHDGVDYAGLVEALPLVVDTRNATRGVTRGREKIVKA